MDIVVAITLFVLALLIGVEVIGKVPATLHTPLMSGANSIHGIVIAGVVIVAAHATSPLAWVFIFLAAVLGTETSDTYNTGENRGRETSHSLNYQKLGRDMPYLFVKSSVALNLS